MNLRQIINAANTTCVEGRLMRHDPQHDDPYLQTDRGQCPDCNGKGCAADDSDGRIGACDCCGEAPVKVTFSVSYGIDTFACAKCRGIEEDE